ncbi:hypothetical protein AB0J81_06005 [Streptomyces bobili]
MVLIAAGFALAAGGLSLAELGLEAPGFSSPSNPAVAGGESSEVDGSAAEPSPSERPLDDGTGAGEASASPSPSASPSASESSKDDKITPTPDGEAPSATRGSSGPPAGSATPSDPESDSAPAGRPTASPKPSPKPSPSETCTRVLWWCS